MITGLPVGETDTAEISFQRLHYGKLVSGRGPHAPARSGYGITRRTSGLDPAADPQLTPPRVLGLRRFDPDSVDAEARARGCFVARPTGDGAMAFLRARFRPEDGEGGHGRLHQQSATWVASFEQWRRYPAACLALAGSELRASPDLAEEAEATRFGGPALRWRVARADDAAVRRLLADQPWASAMLEFLARGAETGVEDVLNFGADDFSRESEFLAAVGLALQFLPESYPRWRDLCVASGLTHALGGVCMRYLPSLRAARVAA